MTLLNEADAIYIGDRAADRVYLGSNLVWEPPSGEGPWTPHEIETAMYGWWDASIPSSLTWSGIYLLEIAGQGPGGLHMGRAASSGPTATTINGLGALAITYDQGLMTVDPTTFNDFTIHAVWNPGFSDGSTYERIVDHSHAAGWWFGRTGGTATFGGGVMEGPPYGVFVPLANNEVHQISSVREGSAHRISGNGGAVVNANTVTTAATASNRVYMGQDNVGLSDLTDGKIGEVIIWKRALTTDEMQKTEGYLAHKWGIQAKLPAGHPYKNYAPGVEPPEPVGPPVTAGLKVWIDASQLGLADGASVSVWPNLVAGGPNGQSVAGATPPKVKANGRNGLSVVHVNALEGRIFWANDTTGVSSPYTVIYVAAKTDLRVSVARVVGAIYPPQNLLMGYYSSFDQCYVGYFIGTPRTPVAGEWNMYTLDSGIGGSRFWNNGVSLPGGGGGENHWGGSLVLGGYDPYVAYDSQCPDADYGELLMYDRMLSDPERISVEDYLRTKWGL